MGTKEVILSISEDEKSLIYKPFDKSITSFLTQKRAYPFDKIASFLYGGTTSTFKKHNR